MSFLLKTEVCDDTRSFCSDQNEFTPNDAPAAEEWATLAANLGGVLGVTLTQTRTRQIAYHVLSQVAAQIAQVDGLLNPGGE